MVSLRFFENPPTTLSSRFKVSWIDTKNTTTPVVIPDGITNTKLKTKFLILQRYKSLGPPSSPGRTVNIHGFIHLSLQTAQTMWPFGVMY